MNYGQKIIKGEMINQGWKGEYEVGTVTKYIHQSVIMSVENRGIRNKAVTIGIRKEKPEGWMLLRYIAEDKCNYITQIGYEKVEWDALIGKEGIIIYHLELDMDSQMDMIIDGFADNDVYNIVYENGEESERVFAKGREPPEYTLSNSQYIDKLIRR